ncbi:MAG: DUF438 domain-containing protein [Actinobacteria bacterium]|nr:DUF438 domain-containing protein [Actinomycetota bacterium]
MNFELKEKIKEIIKRIHAGEDVTGLKNEFKKVLRSVDSAQLAKAEEELIKEGMDRKEIQKLCDVHLEVFKDSIEDSRKELNISRGHPIHTLMEEHKLILSFVEELKYIRDQIKDRNSYDGIEGELEKIKHLAEHLVEANLHHRREEEVLFPKLEEYGIVGPPEIMLSEHEEIKPKKQALLELTENYKHINFKEFLRKLDKLISKISDLLPSHIYKEDNILYPTALSVIKKDEWEEIRRLCDKIGYCCFTPE